MRKIINLSTKAREELVDITEQVKKAVKESGIDNGLVAVYSQGATAAVMIRKTGTKAYRPT